MYGKYFPCLQTAVNVDMLQCKFKLYLTIIPNALNKWHVAIPGYSNFLAGSDFCCIYYPCL